MPKEIVDKAMMETVKQTGSNSVGKLDRVLTNILARLIALCLLVMLLIILLLILLRYIFNEGIVGANETATILFVYTTALGSALALGRNEHVAVRLLIEKLPFRWQTSANIFGLVSVALLNGVMLGHSVFWIRIIGGYLMPTSQLPRICAQLSVPIGCGLAVLYAVVRIISELKTHRESALTEHISRSG